MKTAIITSLMMICVNYTQMEVPTNIDTYFKAWMPYTTITNITSEQYKIQTKAYTDEMGFRKINDDYLVAMGTYYTEKCGTRFKITLQNGLDFTVQTGDIKKDIHTDKHNMYCPIKNQKGELISANVLEFIVDENVMDKHVLYDLGDISPLGFEGNIAKIEKVTFEEKELNIDQ